MPLNGWCQELNYKSWCQELYHNRIIPEQICVGWGLLALEWPKYRLNWPLADDCSVMLHH